MKETDQPLPTSVPSAMPTPEAGEVVLSIKMGIAVLEDLIAMDTSVSSSKEGKMVSNE